MQRRRLQGGRRNEAQLRRLRDRRAQCLRRLRLRRRRPPRAGAEQRPAAVLSLRRQGVRHPRLRLRRQGLTAPACGLFSGSPQQGSVGRRRQDFMTLPRRTFLQLAAGAAALPALPRIAKAQAYPARPVRILVGFPPGGANDIIARLVGHGLAERLGQPFVVENRPGAGSNIAAEAVVRAAPDGYTLLQLTAAQAVNAALYEKLSFNVVRDLAPVASIYHLPMVVEVTPSFPAKTLPEFIAYARAHPGSISYGTGGVGTVAHVGGELFKTLAAPDLLHLPYPATSPPARRASARRARSPAPPDRAEQGRQAHGARRPRRGALAGAAAGADRRRIPAWLRGHDLGRHRRAQGYARRDRRDAQPGAQRG